jgi:hypothetical protein
LKRAIGATVAVIALCACGGATPTASGTPTPSASGSPSPAASALPNITFKVLHGTFPISAVGNSGVTGTAYVTTTSTGFQISVALAGLQDSNPHAVDIDTGTCASPGAVDTKVGTIHLDPSGTAYVNANVTKPYASPTSSGAVVVHTGSDATTAPIACGALGAAS